MATYGFFNDKADSEEQLDAFNAQHCDFIYYDVKKLLDAVGEGDVVVFNELYDASPSLLGALGLVRQIREKGAAFVCVGSDLDSRTSDDVYKTLDALYKLAEAEAANAKASARAASAPARKAPSGKRRGRGGIAPEVIDEALESYQAGESVKNVCAAYGISQGTLYKYIRERGVKRAEAEAAE